MRRRNGWIMAGVLAAALAVGAVFWGLPGGRDVPASTGPNGAGAPDLVLEALQKSGAGVDPASSFALVSRERLSLKAVREGLTVSPSLAYRVAKADLAGHRFRVVPLAAMAGDRVYRFRLALSDGPVRQWAFQTRAAFRILGSLPGDRGQGVPVNTGIEIRFSHADFGDPAGRWEITPAVPGRFEREGKTLVFVPAKPLQPGTVYTVRLRQGLPLTGTDEAIDKDFTFSFETAAPQSQRPARDFGLVGDISEFPAAEAPFFQFWSSGNQLAKAEVTVYRYPDAAAYISALRKLEVVPAWASFSRSRYREGNEGLAQAARLELEVRQSQWSGGYVVFPEALPPGYYRADIRLGDEVRQARFQVSDLALYMAATTTDTLVWVNDIARGGPVAGARVEVAGGRGEGRADASGVATLATPAGYRSAPGQPLFLKVTGAGKEAVAYLPGRDWYQPENPDAERRLDYWKYLYLDRELYRAGDTVHFWGIMAPRERGARPLPQVTVSLVDDSYGPYGRQKSVLAGTTAAVGRGTFTGSLQLPNLKPGAYHLEVRSGDLVLVDRWFQVQTYTKPAYTLEAAAAHRAVFAGEETRFTLKARFFEGTPVKDLAFSYNLDDRSGQVTTDARGQAVIPYRPSPREADSPYRSMSLYVYNSLPEAGEISANASVQVFDSRLFLSGQGTASAGRARVDAQVYQVDLSRLNADAAAAWDDFRGPPAGGRTVKATVVEERWEKIPDGQYYDFIHKVVRERYRYEYRPVTLGEVTLTTDAAGRAVHTFPVERGKSYKVRLETADAGGRATRDTVFVYGSDYAGRADDYRYYHLRAADPERRGYAVGDPAGVVVQLNDGPVPDRPAGFLFYNARRGLQGYRVQDSGSFVHALREADLPQVTVAAVHFDGRQYRPAGSFPIRFDPEGRRLRVAVTPDRAAYRPREKVRLDVRVTDSRGKPAAGAAVNLNLVDEALFALQDQYVNLLAELYGEWIPDGIIVTGHTHQVRELQGGAEKGGEGDGARSDFRDAIFFATVFTDAAGRARAEFRVPDNLTSWRVTYQAVNGRMEAGSGTARIPVKLPFFVEVAAGDEYLAGDRPVLPVRAHGEALRTGQPVTFTVEVTSPGGVVEKRELAGTAFATAWVSLPKLEAGEYSVKVSARTADGLADALRRTLRVVPSFLRRTQVQRHLLSESTRPAGDPDGITVLEFTDARRGAYLSLLRRLQWSYGSRVEFRMARRLAGELLQAHFGEAGVEGEAFDPLEYQAENGGVAILPYADPDLEVSALMADLCPTCLDRVRLARYFRGVLDDNGAGPERAALALYGLAALEEPVLLDVQAALGEKGLEPRVRLFLGLAAAELGDLEGARAVLGDLIRQHGEGTGEALRLNAARDRDGVIATTALAAALAAKLDAPEAVPLVQYLLDNEPEKTLVVLEELLAAQAALPGLPRTAASFSYTLDGATSRVELTPGEPFRLAVTPRQLAGLRFASVRGQVALISRYDGPFRVEGREPAGEATLARAYAVGGRATNVWSPGDLVKVRLKYSISDRAAAGGYEIVDFLPAGLKPVTSPWSRGLYDRNLGYPVEVNGQRVTFAVGRREGEIVYYARVVSAGSYAAESAILQHGRSGQLWAATERTAVTIR